MSGHFQEFEDEYLETMYEFYERDPEALVRTGDLSEALSVSPASATEMIQRLATKGLVEYTPYKGATLTPTGLIHGKKMKRRHRLAEVLLDILPFDGNAHATACRLEHAIDDDLEVALSLLLGRPDLDPSGREIPKASPEILARIEASHKEIRALSSMSEGEHGSLQGMVVSPERLELLQAIGITVGAGISRDPKGYFMDDGRRVELSLELTAQLLFRPS
ncbi:MAG TPA: metal-dependent transcriptional regulator [Candidatus Poseidoniaceae archaeon]|nr:metal-dependent transcriptional regulator [Candidatus Poseidoniaceae archaeon]|tara:strand:- start:3682 stop:4341 length:660 start_codon:yes stop_codon:yes gene_type:complete